MMASKMVLVQLQLQILQVQQVKSILEILVTHQQ